MQRSNHPALLRYGGAVAIVALATAARLALDPILGDLFPFATLFFAALVIAALGGRGPALLAAAIGAILAARFLLPPRDGFVIVGLENWAGLVLYLAVSVGIALLGGTLRAARHRAEAGAEEAVRERERLRITLASIGDAVIVADADGRVTSLNPAAEAITGWPSAEAAGRPLESVFRLGQDEGGRPGPGPASSGARPRPGDLAVLIARDGAVRPIDHKVSPIRDASGAVYGSVVIFREMDERRRAERALAESEARKEAILQTSLDAIITMDHEGRVIEWNAAAERIFGYPPASVMGRELCELIIPPSLREAHRAGLARYLMTGEGPVLGRRIEIDAIRADGSPFPVELAIARISAEGPPIFTAHVRDITEPKRIEKELRDGEQRFRGLMEQAPFSIQILDPGGTTLRVNRAWEELWGVTLDRIRDYNLLADAQLEASGVLDPIRRAFAGEASSVPATRYDPEETLPGRSRHLDPRRWVSAVAYPLKDEAGRVREVVLVHDDITERKSAEEALRASEARFRHLAGAIPQIVWISRPDHSVEFFNERWFRYTGLSEEASYGPEGWRLPVHPDDVERIVRASVRAKATGDPFEAEYRLRDAAGTYRWHLGRAVPVLDEDGQVVRRFGTTTDIDDRKRAERDARFLAEASATLSAIVDEAETLRKVAHLAVPSFADWCSVDLAVEGGPTRRVAVAHIDPAKVELAHELDRRYPPDPAAPTGIPQVIRSGSSEMVAEITDDLIAAGARDEDHLRILRELGLKSYMCVPLRGRAGTLGAITFVAAESGRRYDDDDLRMAEDLAARAAISLDNARLFREIVESEGRSRQLADAMPQIVWTARPDGHRDYYNRRWYELTGREAGEGAGGDEDWLPILHPDDARPCLGAWREAVASGRPYESEYRFLDRRTGDYRWHLGRALPARDESGRVVRWFGTSTDIDDRRRAEDDLRTARDDAEQANRAKNQFLAVLSHELRTPLNPILLATSSMLDGPTDPSEIRSTLEMIRQNVSLQARLIDDLLDVMRIVRGKMPLHWEVVDCHSIIERSIRICRGEIAGGGLRLDLDLAASSCHVNADPARLQQVFWNLIKNAVKFTPEGGSVAVRTGNRPGDGGADAIVVEVSDTGIGIEPGVLPRVFDPFQQGETTITRRFGGLGLGLAICKGVVEAHGGTIVAESGGRGLGTTFRVELAALPGTEADVPAGEATGTGPTAVWAGPSPLRVLVVEDEPTTLRLMARLLRGLGHEVATASTLASAREVSDRGEFDLVISDIGLPDGTGLDLIRRVVAVRGPIPAIALTGFGMEDDVTRSREAGFTAHMTKPIDFTKLAAMIRQVTIREG